VWTLNRDLSEKPPQVDAGASVSGQRTEGDRAKGAAPGEVEGARGRGRADAPAGREYRGDRYGGAAAMRDGRSAIELLARELRIPSPSLTISHDGPTLTVTNAADRTRLFQINGQRDPHQVGESTVVSVSRWDGDRLVTDYDLPSGGKIRIIYSLVPDTRQLLEQVTFANGQTVKRVYDSARSTRRK
jgi:hypothetical protein